MRPLSFSATVCLVAFVVAGSVETRAADVTVALVVQETPATMDTAATLPTSASGFGVGATVFVEVWVRTIDPNGVSQVTADITFDSNQVTAVSITTAAGFTLFENGTIDNANGLIDDLSGSVTPVTPPCSSAVGFAAWARVAEVEMRILGTPAGAVVPMASGSPIFVVATCGSFTPPTVEFVGVSLGAVETAQVELVTLAAPSASDAAGTLPASQTEFVVGDTFFVELWAQTSSARGLSQVSADITFDSSVVGVTSISQSATFSLFPSGSIDNAGGLLDDVSGSVPAMSPPCSAAVGAEPGWARVAVIEVSADQIGMQTFQAMESANPIFVVATCGDFLAPVSTFGSAAVNIVCRVASEAIALEAMPQAKTRFLSMVPGNAGIEVALRVTLVNVDGFPGANGSTLWVGPPQVFPDADSGDPGRTFLGAALQCEPHFQDWGTVGVLHVFGAEVIPSSSMELNAVSLSCFADQGNGADFGPSTPITTSRWADVVEPFFVNVGDIQPDLKDITAVVSKFLGDPTAPSKAVAQMQPNVVDPLQLINFKDVSAAVASFLNVAYVDGLGISGPCVCPSAMICGTVSCGGDPDCTGGFCVNGFCTDACRRCTP